MRYLVLTKRVREVSEEEFFRLLRGLRSINVKVTREETRLNLRKEV